LSVLVLKRVQVLSNQTCSCRQWTHPVTRQCAVRALCTRGQTLPPTSKVPATVVLVGQSLTCFSSCNHDSGAIARGIRMYFYRHHRMTYTCHSGTATFLVGYDALQDVFQRISDLGLSLYRSTSVDSFSALRRRSIEHLTFLDTVLSFFHQSLKSSHQYILWGRHISDGSTFFHSRHFAAATSQSASYCQSHHCHQCSCGNRGSRPEGLFQRRGLIRSKSSQTQHTWPTNSEACGLMNTTGWSAGWQGLPTPTIGGC
jgi:hypothetical protein